MRGISVVRQKISPINQKNSPNNLTDPPRSAENLPNPNSSTVSPTWAVTNDYRKEKDALAEYQLESPDTPDLPEPELPAPTLGPAGDPGVVHLRNRL